MRRPLRHATERCSDPRENSARLDDVGRLDIARLSGDGRRVSLDQRDNDPGRSYASITLLSQPKHMSPS